MHRRPLLNIAAYAYLFAMLALLFMPLMARAQNPALSSTPPPGKMLLNVFQTTSGQNVYSYGAGIATAAHAPGLDAKMWNDALAVDTYTSLDVGNNVKAPIGARSVPTKPDVAKAVGNFARGVGGAALKTAGAVYAAAEIAAALNDLCNELGYSCYKGADGQTKVDKANPFACASQCYTWQVYAYNGAAFPDVFNSSSEAKAWWEAKVNTSAVAAGGAPRAFTWYADGNNFYACENGSCFYTGGVRRLGSRVPDAAGSGGTPSSLQELEATIAAKSGWPSSTALPKVVEQSVASGSPLPLPAPSQVTGPSIIPLVPTITEFPDGSKTTVTPEKRLTFGQASPTVTVTDGTTTTTTTPTGTTTVVSSASSPAALPAPEIKIETCGLPGTPACKIDETGTPAPIAATGYDAALDPFKQSTDENRDLIAGTADKSFFTGWSMFFAAPAVVQCQPLVMPTYLGVQIGSLDPCPVADGMRQVMAYIWALGAFWLCLGMVRGVI